MWWHHLTHSDRWFAVFLHHPIHAVLPAYSRWFHRVNCRCRKFCRRIIKSQTFYWLVIVLVFFNTCTLTSEHNHQPDWLDRFQGTMILIFADVTSRVQKGPDPTFWSVVACPPTFRGHQIQHLAFTTLQTFRGCARAQCKLNIKNSFSSSTPQVPAFQTQKGRFALVKILRFLGNWEGLGYVNWSKLGMWLDVDWHRDEPKL